MESEANAIRFRFPSKVIQNRGTWYIHIPKDYAGIMGVTEGCVLEVGVLAVHPKAERKAK